MPNLLFSPGTSTLEPADLLDGRYRIVQILNSNPWGQTHLAQDTRRPSQPQCIIQQIKINSTAGHGTTSHSHTSGLDNGISGDNGTGYAAASNHEETDYEDAIRHLFVREAAILERLADHHQIPQLLACFEDSQGFYLVQEFVSGYPLSVELQPNQPWHPNRVVQLLLECLDPLAFVHSQGMRHGNLKPDNLLRRVQDDRLVLVNFDSIRQLQLSLMILFGQAESAIAPVNQEYQPPEQLEGMPCLASDVYAVGMIALQALTGVHPVLLQHDPETGEVLWQPHYQEPETELGQGLIAILSRMVRSDPNQRYGSGVEALEDIRQLLQSTPFQHFPPPDATEPVLHSDPAQLVEAHPHSALASDAPDSAGATLLVGAGIGAVLSATVCGYVILVSPTAPIDQGPQLLERATKQFQSGQLPQAISLAESIPMTSRAYPSAQTAIARWQKDWKLAATTYQAILAAFNQDNWLEVLRQRKKMPDIAHWQEQTASLMREATVKADTAAMKLIKQAYDKAVAKDFAGAIAALKQIPEETSVYKKAQEKLREYSQKQESNATALLQNAYDRAIIRDFSSSLNYLKQIPRGTTVYAKAQEKIQEYGEKQKIQAQTWLVTAYRQAEAQDFRSALTTLDKIPEGTRLDEDVEEKTTEYTEKLYVWSDYWLQKATEQARQRNFDAARTSLEKIPIGTPAYSAAREKIAQYSTEQRQQPESPTSKEPVSFATELEKIFPTFPPDSASASPSRPVSPNQGLNPGNYLRAAEPWKNQ